VIVLMLAHRGYEIRIYTKQSANPQALDYFFSVELSARIHLGTTPRAWGPFLSRTVENAASDAVLRDQALHEVRMLAIAYVDNLLQTLADPEQARRTLDGLH